MNEKMKSLLNTPVSLVKGLKVTMTNLIRSKTTVKYPEVMPTPMGQSQPDGEDEFDRPYEMAPRFRGLHGLTRDPITGDHNCIGCMACAKVCPDDLISMDLEKREGHNGRFPVTFNVNIGPCCFCGLCAEVCPTPMRAIVMTDLFEWASYRRDGANLVLNRQDLERHGDYEVERRSSGRIWEEDGKLKAVLPEEEGNPYFQFAPEYDAERAGKSLAEVQADQPSPKERKAEFEAQATAAEPAPEEKPAEPAPKAAKPEPAPSAPAAPAEDPMIKVRELFESAGMAVPEDLGAFDLESLDGIEDRKLRGQMKSAVVKARKALPQGEAHAETSPSAPAVTSTASEPEIETGPEPTASGSGTNPVETDPVQGDETAELRANLVEVLRAAAMDVPDQPEAMNLSDLDAIDDRKLRGQAKSALRKLQRSLGLVD